MSFSKPKGSTNNAIERIVKAYVKSLHERPILTKAVTSAFTAGLGNFLSQLISGAPDVRWRSVAAFATTGFVFVGPIIHHFLIWIDQVMPRTEKYASVKRLILDRIVFAPPFLLIYFYLIALLEGQSSGEALHRIRQFFWPTLIMNLKIWTPLQFININYVPREFRVLFANVVSLGWTIYAANSRK